MDFLVEIHVNPRGIHFHPCRIPCRIPRRNPSKYFQQGSLHDESRNRNFKVLEDPTLFNRSRVDALFQPEENNETEDLTQL